MISQLECFKATVAHKKQAGYLFYADFAPDLERRVRAEFELGPETNLRDYFGMFNHQGVVPRRPENY
ncbi:MAG: hypothetical protein QME64_08740, partial [bacterium]|nr:hypothetical protein [bacterium]